MFGTDKRKVFFVLKRNQANIPEKNFKAIRFYKKNGFIEFDKHIFKLGNDEQTDIMMKLIL